MLFLKNIIFILLAINTAYSTTDWRGHNRFILNGSYDGAIEDSHQLVLNHRSEILYSKKSHSFEVAYELFFIYDDIQISNSNARYKHRGADLDYFILDDKHSSGQKTQATQNLDRLFYTYSNEKVDIQIGRQPIAFGSARMINPLDVLVPFEFVTVNTEQRLGIDAFRFKYSISEMGLINMGMAYDENLDSDEQFKFFSIRETILGVDSLFLLQSIYDSTILGLDFQWNLFGWGMWFENAFFNSNSLDSFVRSSLGGQYLFQNDISLFAEYHYNELEKSNATYGIFTSNKHYMNWGLSYALTPLQSINSSFLVNLDSSSVLATFAYQNNISQNWYIDSSFFLGIGDSSSEFGQYPIVVSLSLKNFF